MKIKNDILLSYLLTYEYSIDFHMNIDFSESYIDYYVISFCLKKKADNLSAF